MMTTSEFANVNEMYRDAIYSMPIECDWTERAYGEDWDFEEAPIVDEEDAANCDECGEQIIYRDGEWAHAEGDEADHDAEPDDEWRDDHRGEGPMMNYWYPVEIRGMREAAEQIADLPLCVVRVDEETGLALTGGGMDLSWEICEAFLRIGSLPPVHFSNLPKMAGRGTSDTDRWIIAGCLRTAEILRMDADRLAADLAQF